MILASNNAHKLEEFRAIFADMGIEIIPQSAAGCHFEVDETGETFEENAYLKAIAVTRATGQPAVADDSGLMVDALGGAPGVHSARYTGRHEDSDAARYTLLLHNLGDRTDRTARFVSCICCTFPNGDVRGRPKVLVLMSCAPAARARAASCLRRAGKTASAMTPCFSRTAMPAPWRSCARKRKTPFPTAGMRSKS